MVPIESIFFFTFQTGAGVSLHSKKKFLDVPLSTLLSKRGAVVCRVGETLLGKFKNKFAFRHYRRLGNAMEDAVFKGEIHPLNPRELVPRNSMY